MRTYIYLLTISLLFAACGENIKDSDKATIDTLTYTSKTIYKESTNIVKSSPANDTTYIRIGYPSFNDSLINRFVSDLILQSDNPDKKYGSIQELADSFIADFDTFYVKEKEYKRSWYKEIDLKAEVQDAGLISFEKKAADYTGGAHGYYGTYYANYDLSQKKKIELTDLFTPENLDSLTKAAERIFRKNENLKPGESFNNTYFFENQKFTLNNNFMIWKKGLTFLYNPYEIKPYASGQTELFVPYSEIKQFIKPESPVAAYLQ